MAKNDENMTKSEKIIGPERDGRLSLQNNRELMYVRAETQIFTLVRGGELNSSNKQ